MKTLTKAHEKLIRKEIACRTEYAPGYVFPNGWDSTSSKSPADGCIDTDIENGEILAFTDKYRHDHVGVVSGISYEKNMKGLTISVVCYEFSIFETNKFDFHNFGMRAKHSKDSRIKVMAKDKNLLAELEEYSGPKYKNI